MSNPVELPSEDAWRQLSHRRDPWRKTSLIEVEVPKFICTIGISVGQGVLFADRGIGSQGRVGFADGNATAL